MDSEVDYSALVAKRSAPCWLRALADAGLLEQALWRRFERYGPSPPAVRRRIANVYPEHGWAFSGKSVTKPQVEQS